MALQRLNCLELLEGVQASEEARNVWEAYDPSKAYVRYNKVAYEGSCYVCHADAPAGTLPTNEAYYTLIAQGGQAATISIGSVTTAPAGSPVSVTNTGNPNAAVLNFSIPAGADAGDAYADAIVCTAEGAPVVITDAAAKRLRGMRIYGKTTQDGTPSPTAPVELVHAGAAGTVNVQLSGRNLLKFVCAAQTINGLNISFAGDGSITIKGTATASTFYGINYDIRTLEAGVRYRLSGCPAGGSGSAYMLYAQTNGGGVVVRDVGNGVTFTATDEQWQVLFAVYSGNTVDFTFYPMLQRADIASDEFEAYKDVQKIAVATPNGLPAVPVAQNGNYIDADGQMWIADEIDLERGVYVQNVVTEAVTFAYDTDNKRYKCTTSKKMHSGYGTATAVPVMCNVLEYNPLAGAGTPMQNGVRGAATSPYNLIANYNGGLISDAVVTYPLASPVETALPAELVTAYKALVSKYPNTVVTNDAGAWSAVDYVADTKLYAGEHGSGGTVTPEQLEQAIAEYLAQHQISGTAARVANVTLRASSWKGAASPYYQVVTIAGVTPLSQVDLTPSIEQLAIFHDKDLAFVTENEDGVVTVYALGDKPQNDYTMQVTITEVVV